MVLLLTAIAVTLATVVVVVIIVVVPCSIVNSWLLFTAPTPIARRFKLLVVRW